MFYDNGLCFSIRNDNFEFNSLFGTCVNDSSDDGASLRLQLLALSRSVDADSIPRHWFRR